MPSWVRIAFVPVLTSCCSDKIAAETTAGTLVIAQPDVLSVQTSVQLGEGVAVGGPQ